MPISIYCNDDSKAEVAWLCDDDWSLCPQVSALQEWLDQSTGAIVSGRYTADIGYSVREDGTAGGAAIPPEMMRRMADLGMTLFLSEYPPLKEAIDEAPQKT